MSGKRRGRGRPPLGDSTTTRLQMLVTEDDRATWQSAAGEQPLTAWLRDVANRAAKRAASPAVERAIDGIRAVANRRR